MYRKVKQVMSSDELNIRSLKLRPLGKKSASVHSPMSSVIVFFALYTD